MSPSKKIYGLIGFPVKHSLSPAMHNAAFKAAGIDGEYKLFEVKPEELEDFLVNPNKEVQDIESNVIRAGNIVGFNITIPYKIRAREILMRSVNLLDIDRESEFYADYSGAINTVKRENGKISYRNTDAPGFVKSLRENLNFNAKGKEIFLIGCGGVGRAVVAGLTWKDIGIEKIYIYEISDNIREDAQKKFFRYNDLKNKLEFISKEKIQKVLKECDLLVNATPLGMKDNDPSPIEKNLLYKGLYVYDVVYNRNKDTQLIQDAKALGCKHENGLSMLLYQGVLAWEHWTGKDAPVSIMRQALKEAIRN